MKLVCVVCEGESEATFVENMLSEELSSLGLIIYSQLIATSPGHKGGALSYDRVSRHLVNTLRQNSAPVVTTMIDLYRLHNKFPGYAASIQQNDLGRRLDVLKQALHEDIVSKAKCRPEQFIPYFQPFEFEALLFSDLHWTTRDEFGWKSAFAKLDAVRQAAQSPEHINDRPESTPAAHLQRILKAPTYKKLLHGPLAAKDIGIEKIESECAFFAAWLNQLRKLAVNPTS